MKNRMIDTGFQNIVKRAAKTIIPPIANKLQNRASLEIGLDDDFLNQKKRRNEITSPVV